MGRAFDLRLVTSHRDRRASWQLPGLDFHREATTSLRTRCYVTASPPVLLGARKARANATRDLLPPEPLAVS